MILSKFVRLESRTYKTCRGELRGTRDGRGGLASAHAKRQIAVKGERVGKASAGPASRRIAYRVSAF
jgi:hypothetical protein